MIKQGSAISFLFLLLSCQPKQVSIPKLDDDNLDSLLRKHLHATGVNHISIYKYGDSSNTIKYQFSLSDSLIFGNYIFPADKWQERKVRFQCESNWIQQDYGSVDMLMLNLFRAIKISDETYKDSSGTKLFIIKGKERRNNGLEYISIEKLSINR